MNGSDWFFVGFNGGLLAMLAIHYLLEKRLGSKTESALDEMFVRGVNLAARNHGDWIRRHERLDVHGYGIRCTECERVFMVVAHVRSDYTRCPDCGERLPAPLAPQKEVSHV